MRSDLQGLSGWPLDVARRQDASLQRWSSESGISARQAKPLLAPFSSRLNEAMPTMVVPFRTSTPGVRNARPHLTCCLAGSTG
jgi:hypothetical protein